MIGGECRKTDITEIRVNDLFVSDPGNIASVFNQHFIDVVDVLRTKYKYPSNKCVL